MELWYGLTQLEIDAVSHDGRSRDLTAHHGQSARQMEHEGRPTSATTFCLKAAELAQSKPGKISAEGGDDQPWSAEADVNTQEHERIRSPDEDNDASSRVTTIGDQAYSDQTMAEEHAAREQTYSDRATVDGNAAPNETDSDQAMAQGNAAPNEADSDQTMAQGNAAPNEADSDQTMAERNAGSGDVNLNQKMTEGNAGLNEAGSDRTMLEGNAGREQEYSDRIMQEGNTTPDEASLDRVAEEGNTGHEEAYSDRTMEAANTGRQQAYSDQATKEGNTACEQPHSDRTTEQGDATPDEANSDRTAEDGNPARMVHIEKGGGQTEWDTTNEDNRKHNAGVDEVGKLCEESTPQCKEAQPDGPLEEKYVLRKTETYCGSNVPSVPTREHDLSPSTKVTLAESRLGGRNGARFCVGETGAKVMLAHGLVAHTNAAEHTVPQWGSAVVEVRTMPIPLAPETHVPAASIAPAMECLASSVEAVYNSKPTANPDAKERVVIHSLSVEPIQTAKCQAAHLGVFESRAAYDAGLRSMPRAGAHCVRSLPVEVRSAPSGSSSGLPTTEEATALVDPPAVLGEELSLLTEPFTTSTSAADALRFLFTARHTLSVAHSAPTETDDDKPAPTSNTEVPVAIAAAHHSVVGSKRKPASPKGASCKGKHRPENTLPPDAPNSSFKVDHTTTPSSVCELERTCAVCPNALVAPTEMLRPVEAALVSTITPTNGLQSSMKQGSLRDDSSALPPSPPPEITKGSPNYEASSSRSQVFATSRPQGSDRQTVGTCVAPPLEVPHATTSPTAVIWHGPSISNIQPPNTLGVAHHSPEPIDATVSAFVESTFLKLLGADAPCVQVGRGPRERMSFRRQPQRNSKVRHSYYANDGFLHTQHCSRMLKDEHAGANVPHSPKAVGAQSQDVGARAQHGDMPMNVRHELMTQSGHCGSPESDMTAARVVAAQGQVRAKDELTRSARPQHGQRASLTAETTTGVLWRPASAPVLKKEIHRTAPLINTTGAPNRFCHSTLSTTARTAPYQNLHSSAPNGRGRTHRTAAPLTGVSSRSQSRGNQQLSASRQIPRGGTLGRSVRRQSCDNSSDRGPSDTQSKRRCSTNARRPLQQHQQQQEQEQQERATPIAADVAKMREDVDILTADMAALRDTMDRIRSEKTALYDELVGLGKDIPALQACSAEKQVEKNALDAALKDLEQHNAQVRARISQAKDEKHTLRCVLNVLEENNVELRDAIAYQEKEKAWASRTFCGLHGAASDLNSPTPLEEYKTKKVQNGHEVKKTEEAAAASFGVQDDTGKVEKLASAPFAAQDKVDKLKELAFATYAVESEITKPKKNAIASSATQEEVQNEVAVASRAVQEEVEKAEKLPAASRAVQDEVKKTTEVAVASRGLREEVEKAEKRASVPRATQDEIKKTKEVAVASHALQEEVKKAEKLASAPRAVQDEVEKTRQVGAAKCAVQADCGSEKRLLACLEWIATDGYDDAVSNAHLDATAIRGSRLDAGEPTRALAGMLSARSGDGGERANEPQMDAHTALSASKNTPFVVLDRGERTDGGVQPAPRQSLAIEVGDLNGAARGPALVGAAEEKREGSLENPSALHTSSLIRRCADAGSKPGLLGNFRVPTLRPNPDPATEHRLAQTEGARKDVDLAMTDPPSGLWRPLEKRESAYSYSTGRDGDETNTATMRGPLTNVKNERATAACVPIRVKQGGTEGATQGESAGCVFPTMVATKDDAARHESTMGRRTGSGASSLTRAGGAGDGSGSSYSDDTLTSPRSRRSSNSSRSAHLWERPTAQRTAECTRGAATGDSEQADAIAERYAGERAECLARSQRDAGGSSITYGMPSRSVHVDADGTVWKLRTGDPEDARRGVSLSATGGTPRSVVGSDSAAWSNHKSVVPLSNMEVHPPSQTLGARHRSSNVRAKIEAALALSVNLETQRKQRRDHEESGRELEVQVRELAPYEETRPASTRESRCEKPRILDLCASRPSPAGASVAQPISVPQQRLQKLELHGSKNGPVILAQGLPNSTESTDMREEESTQQRAAQWPSKLQAGKVDWPRLVRLASGKYCR